MKYILAVSDKSFKKFATKKELLEYVYDNPDFESGFLYAVFKQDSEEVAAKPYMHMFVRKKSDSTIYGELLPIPTVKTPY